MLDDRAPRRGLGAGREHRADRVERGAPVGLLARAAVAGRERSFERLDEEVQRLVGHPMVHGREVVGDLLHQEQRAVRDQEADHACDLVLRLPGRVDRARDRAQQAHQVAEDVVLVHLDRRAHEPVEGGAPALVAVGLHQREQQLPPLAARLASQLVEQRLRSEGPEEAQQHAREALPVLGGQQLAQPLAVEGLVPLGAQRLDGVGGDLCALDHLEGEVEHPHRAPEGAGVELLDRALDHLAEAARGFPLVVRERDHPPHGRERPARLVAVRKPGRPPARQLLAEQSEHVVGVLDQPGRAELVELRLHLGGRGRAGRGGGEGLRGEGLAPLGSGGGRETGERVEHEVEAAQERGRQRERRGQAQALLPSSPPRGGPARAPRAAALLASPLAARAVDPLDLFDGLAARLAQPRELRGERRPLGRRRQLEDGHLEASEERLEERRRHEPELADDLHLPERVEEVVGDRQGRRGPLGAPPRCSTALATRWMGARARTIIASDTISGATRSDRYWSSSPSASATTESGITGWFMARWRSGESLHVPGRPLTRDASVGLKRRESTARTRVGRDGGDRCDAACSSPRSTAPR